MVSLVCSVSKYEATGILLDFIAISITIIFERGRYKSKRRGIVECLYLLEKGRRDGMGEDCKKIETFNLEPK